MRPRSVATVVVIVASIWFALAVGWGAFGPLTGTSGPAVGVRGIAAENMLTWDVWGPVHQYVTTRPSPQLYDLDQPWGTFWAIRGLMKVLGRHSYVLRVEAVLMSMATPPLLYGIGRALWGPGPAALSALAYVVVPITLAFGNAPGSGAALVFGCLLTTWGYVRFAKRWRRRWLAVSVLGVVWTANVAWQGSIFLGVVLGCFLVTQYVAPLWFGRAPARRFGQWWAFSMAATSLTILGYVAYFVHIGAIERLLAQLALRENAQDPSFRQLLEHRSYWTALAFTPVVIGVAKATVPIFLVRLLLLRKKCEIFPLALAVSAATGPVHIPTDVDAAFSLPLPFAAYWALSLGVLATVCVNAGRWVLRRFGRRDEAGVIPLGTYAGLGILAILVLPDGVRALSLGRVAGGLFDPHGLRTFEERGKSAVLEWMSERMTAPTRVQLHASLHPTASDEWALHRPAAVVDAPPSRTARIEDRYFVGDLSFMSAADRAILGLQFHVVGVGPFVLIDRTGPNGPADGYSLEMEQPSTFEWCFVSGPAPVVRVRPDPWYTWELREFFEQAPNPLPPGPPSTTEQLRVAHNIAVATADRTGAAQYEAKLVDSLLVYPALTFTDGTRLLGVHFTAGVAPRLDVYFVAGSGPGRDGVEFEIESVVQKKALLSLVPGDVRRSVLGPPLVVPVKLWRSGFIYASRTEVHPRPGSETFLGAFVGPDNARVPRPRDGSTKVRLLTLE